MRIFVGALISIILVSLTTMSVFWVALIGTHQQQLSTVVAGIISAIVATIVMLVWAVPMHILLTYKNKTKYYWYLAVGMIPGPLYTFLFKPFGGHDEFKYLIPQSILCSLIGAIGAMSFWFYVVKRQAHNNALNTDGTKSSATG